ncbi:hypothetical protein ACFOU0_10780 [Salinicoccus sesuvii]|uniref:Uncharacterized protein n=1 Tax=Salinicoccus sesuvii TaxID=868281 RepID=A0ABV7N940_9STAP
MSFFIPRTTLNHSKKPLDFLKEKKRYTKLTREKRNILEEYMEVGNSFKDIVVNMTKKTDITLIGGVIGEYKNEVKQSSVMYCCRTVASAENLKASLDIYGIEAMLFIDEEDIDSQKLAHYIRGKSIAVTTYEMLFDGSSTIPHADILIFDDLESIEEEMYRLWSLRISVSDVATENLHNELLRFLNQCTENSVLDTGDTHINASSTNIIPRAQWHEKIDELSHIIDTGIEKHSGLAKSWMRIKQMLLLCDIYIDRDLITIEPFRIPAQSNRAFSNARERIYLSSGLEAGTIEQNFGVESLEYLKLRKKHLSSTDGRRLFLFPQDHFKGEALTQTIVDTIRLHHTVHIHYLTTHSNDYFINHLEPNLSNYNIHKGADINSEQSASISLRKIKLVRSGTEKQERLPEAELHIYLDAPVLPRASERFVVDQLNTTTEFEGTFAKQWTRQLKQAQSKKYCSIMVLDNSARNFLNSQTCLNQMPADIYSELLLAYAQVTASVTQEVWLSNISAFVEQGKVWRPAERFIEQTQSELKEQKLSTHKSDNLMRTEIAELEVGYMEALRQNNYHSAKNKIEALIKKVEAIPKFSGSLAWYHYQLNTLEVMINGSAENDIAFSPSTLHSRDRVLKAEEKQIVGMIRNLQLYGDCRDLFDKECNSIMNLIYSNDAMEVSLGLCGLGRLLGADVIQSKDNGEYNCSWNVASLNIPMSVSTVEDDEIDRTAASLLIYLSDVQVKSKTIQQWAKRVVKVFMVAMEILKKEGVLSARSYLREKIQSETLTLEQLDQWVQSENEKLVFA